MKTRYRTFFKSSDARGFLFFLLLTSCIAVLIKLSKEYTKVYELPIQITDVPVASTIKTITPERISFNTAQSGFRLLSNSFREQKLEIPFSNLDSLSKSRYAIKTAALEPLLKKSVSSTASFSNYSTDNITVVIDILSNKKVPVLADIALDFKSGYNTNGVARITPDSVTVVGALGILDKIQAVQTKKRNIAEVDKDIKVAIELDTLALYKEIKLSQTRFEFSQKVARFTEGSFTIPVTIRGTSEGAIKIFPKEVALFFVASLDAYDDILPTDFEVIADFSNSNLTEEFIVLTVARQPKNVRNVRLETKQIKFLVVH